MCGIIGMIGPDQENVVPFLMKSLKKMEYRGYDSAGIAVISDDQFLRHRAKGKVSALEEVQKKDPLSASMGIGHIRWATHGAVTVENAHPHQSHHVMLVHNGIIENWQELKEELNNKNFQFSSETDTEVIAHLIQDFLDKGLSAFEAFQNTLKKLDGAYALAVMIGGEDRLFVARKGSPLVIGVGDDEMYIGSDALTLAAKTSQVIFLDEGDYAIVNQNTVEIYDQNDQKIQKDIVDTGLTTEENDKAGFPFYMLKEIYEQPQVLADLIGRYIDVENHTIKPMDFGIHAQDISRMSFIACGTAYHSGMLGKYYMESLARIPVDVDFASEYRYRDLIQPENGVFVAFSQSGETADTLSAMRRASAEGQHTIAVVNVESSTMAREANHILPTIAGVEVGVASTKAFTAQSFIVLIMAVYLARQKNIMSLDEEKAIVKEILSLPRLFNLALEQSEHIEEIGKAISPAQDVLFLGRSRSFPIALEAALKLKEISYIHAEAYASGEMKHGAIALIDENVPVVVLAPSDHVLDKSLSNMEEVAARDAKVILVAESDVCEKNNAFKKIVMPKAHPLTAPILYTLPMQLLSYYAAIALDRDVDQPRNLAKSVTVE